MISRARIAREIIGPPECPILHRWTLLDLGPRGVKVMVHRFLPNADDRDVHDHPRPFITCVLAGSYDDLVPCPACNGLGITRPDNPGSSCTVCDHGGLVVGDHMRRGTIRRRLASHQHRTLVGPNGCWTLVLMGPLRRPWGFWREGRWWPFRAYENQFGFGMRCGDEDPR